MGTAVFSHLRNPRSTLDLQSLLDTGLHGFNRFKALTSMVLLQGTRAVLRPLLDFVKLCAECQAQEDKQVRENTISSRETLIAWVLFS